MMNQMMIIRMIVNIVAVLGIIAVLSVNIVIKKTLDISENLQYIPSHVFYHKHYLSGRAIYASL